jgi:uncharacterized protein involved in exopolysaccharide biosynthesis
MAAARAATASVALSFIRLTRVETCIAAAESRESRRRAAIRDGRTLTRMHYDSHQPVLNDLEARITTIRDSL